MLLSADDLKDHRVYLRRVASESENMSMVGIRLVL